MSNCTSTVTLDGKENVKATRRTSQRKRAKSNDTAGRVQRQTKSTVRKSKTGRLSQLMSIPMDVLMEVFGHLHPLDLLHLARTTKAFRRVLMHKSSLFVWKAALSTVPGLPDCPPDLSEPQWTNLVFDTHCGICLRPNIRNVDWTLRVRLCADCNTQHIAEWCEFFGHIDGDKMLSGVSYRIGKRGFPEFLRDKYQEVYDQYRAIENLDARRAFLEERHRRVKAIKEHAMLCTEWASSQAVARSDELVELKSRRYKAIVAKLVALGWGDEIKKLPRASALKGHKLVKVPQLLTDRIWANISGTMINYMEEMKANRLARELRQLHTQRQLDAIKLLRAYKIDCAPFTNVMPEPFDFCAFGPVKEILDQPPDINVDADSFMHLMPELHGVVDEWRRVILNKFINEVKVGIVERSSVLDVNPLDLDVPDDSILQRIQLACTVFACIPCGEPQPSDHLVNIFPDLPFNFRITAQFPFTRPLWFPRVLGHRCLAKPPSYAIADPTMRLDKLQCHRQPWSCDSTIKVDKAACQAAVVIIEACGMDPSIVTVDQMDELDARLECLACLKPNVKDPYHMVFGWRSAVKHQRECHPLDSGDWRLLNASEAEVARVEENDWGVTVPRPVVQSDRKVWLCLHCLDGPYEESWMTLDDVQGHVQLFHRVEEPQVNRDYVKDSAAPELYATSVLFKVSMVKFPE